MFHASSASRDAATCIKCVTFHHRRECCPSGAPVVLNDHLRVTLPQVAPGRGLFRFAALAHGALTNTAESLDLPLARWQTS